MKYKKYDKSFDYSYTLGQFPTIELIKSKKARIIALICHEKLAMSDEIKSILDYTEKHNIEVIHSTKQVEALSSKDNCYLVGVFEKYHDKLSSGNHIVLVSPQDSGNLGTIIRTMLGLNLTNLAIIENGKNTTNKFELEKSKTSLDIFNPKVIRSSMGSIFGMNIEVFHTFDDYDKAFASNEKFAFCLDSASFLSNTTCDKSKNFSLVFGNEATGLGKEIYSKCKCVKIEQSSKIDSFNLAISVGIGAYHFCSQKKGDKNEQ